MTDRRRPHVPGRLPPCSLVCRRGHLAPVPSVTREYHSAQSSSSSSSFGAAPVWWLAQPLPRPARLLGRAVALSLLQRSLIGFISRQSMSTAASAAKAAAAAGLQPFKALGGLTLYAPSAGDAQAEAHANEEGQVYFGRGSVALQEGASAIGAAGTHRAVVQQLLHAQNAAGRWRHTPRSRWGRTQHPQLSQVPPETQFQMHTGDVVLDLGANVGAFARMSAPSLGASGVVYAVEPIPQVHSYFCPLMCHCCLFCCKCASIKGLHEGQRRRLCSRAHTPGDPIVQLCECSGVPKAAHTPPACSFMHRLGPEAEYDNPNIPLSCKVVEALELNSRLFAEWAAARGLPVARVVPVQAGERR